MLITPAFGWIESATSVARRKAHRKSEQRIAAASEAEKRAAAATRYPALFGAKPAVLDVASIFFDRIWRDSRDHMSAEDRNVREAIEVRLRELKIAAV